MFSASGFSYKATRTGAATLIIAVTAALAACGGDDDGAKTKPVAQAVKPGATAMSFDGIFLKDSGAGYYEFTAATDDADELVGTAVRQLYVTASSDTSFSQTFSSILGSVPQMFSGETYITDAGAYSPSNPVTGDVRIFQKLPHGYQSGVSGFATPLYEISIDAYDVSAQPVGKVIVARDEAAYFSGLSRVLYEVSTPMPTGALIYQTPLKVLTTHLWFKGSSKAGARSLEELQVAYGTGTIGTLGGYRYLTGEGIPTYIEYGQNIYYGVLQKVGDIRDARPAAYNRIAADFIVAEQKKVGLPEKRR
jgi:hypothetical protein